VTARGFSPFIYTFCFAFDLIFNLQVFHTSFPQFLTRGSFGVPLTRSFNSSIFTLNVMFLHVVSVFRDFPPQSVWTPFFWGVVHQAVFFLTGTLPNRFFFCLFNPPRGPSRRSVFPLLLDFAMAHSFSCFPLIPAFLYVWIQVIQSGPAFVPFFFLFLHLSAQFFPLVF